MDYQFKALGKRCAATGTELVPGTVCHTVLVEDDDGELTRLDYSETGWKGPPPHVVGYWRTVVPKPVDVKRQLLDPQALLACFDQMTEAAQPGQEKLRYILALLLLQKKRLRLDGSRPEGEDEFLQLVGSHGEGPYEVCDMQLEEHEVHELQQQLNAHLAAEWGTISPPVAVLPEE